MGNCCSTGSTKSASPTNTTTKTKGPDNNNNNDDDDKITQHTNLKAKAPGPTNICDGYFFYMTPTLIKNGTVEEVNFYITSPSKHTNNNSDGGENVAKDIACTMSTTPGANMVIRSNNKKNDDDFFLPSDRIKPVILIFHGYLSWRNQMLISNLAAELVNEFDGKCHAIRFDFGGHGHSSGEWRYANYDGLCNDLDRVVTFVREVLCCDVCCVIGHSMGTVPLFRHALGQQRRHQQEQENETKQVRDDEEKGDDATEELLSTETASEKKRKNVPCYVNLAGRYYIPNERDYLNDFSPSERDKFTQYGKFELSPQGSTRKRIVTKQDIDLKNKYDSSFVQHINGDSVKVLTIHGDSDTEVDILSAYKYDEMISNHELCIIQNADHNFNGLKYMKEIVNAIESFLQRNAGV